MTELYGPGPDGNSGDNYNEDPRGVDANDVGPRFGHGPQHLR